MHWDVSMENKASERETRLVPYAGGGGPASPAKQGKKRPLGGGKSPKGSPATPVKLESPQNHQHLGKPSSWAAQLRDKTKLCADFQNDRCSVRDKYCQKGAHKCAKILKSGRVCGFTNHCAKNCKNP